MPQLEKDTRPFAIVVKGEITWQGQGFPMEKFCATCKYHFREVVWGDHGTMKKRKRDPKYISLRGNGREPRCVLVNIENAPDNWLDEIKSIYKW